MNFIISSSVLLKQLQSISKVISSKNTLPILDNFLFKLDSNGLTITASDLETTITTTIELDQMSGEGEISIDAKRITGFLKEFPEQPLTFNIAEDLQIDVISSTGKFSLKGESGEDFPSIPELQGDVHNIQLNSEIVLEGINKTLFAASTDDLRPIITGVFIELTTEHINFVATNAHNLVRYRRTDIKAEENASFILPPKPAGLLKTILTKDETPVNVQFDEQNAKIEYANNTIICRLLEGNYPNYEAVIPTGNENTLTIDRLDLHTSLRRVAMFSNQANNLIQLSLSANEVVVSAQDIDFSISGRERVRCQYEGENMDIGFKSSFLIEIMDNLPTQNIEVKLGDPTKAGLFMPVDNDSENEEILMLLMPMQIT